MCIFFWTNFHCLPCIVIFNATTQHFSVPFFPTFITVYVLPTSIYAFFVCSFCGLIFLCSMFLWCILSSTASVVTFCWNSFGAAQVTMYTFLYLVFSIHCNDPNPITRRKLLPRKKKLSYKKRSKCTTHTKNALNLKIQAMYI